MNRAIRVILTLCIILFVVSGAIALPLVVRPFYYSQIEKLGIPESTGYSVEDARKAYDEMMDYCMGKSEEFGTGKLAWSDEGKSHFDDCKALFTLDKRLFILSLEGIAICIGFICALYNVTRATRGGDTLRKDGTRNEVGNAKWGLKIALLDETLTAGAQAGIIMLFLSMVLGVMGAVNFEVFFVKFHHTFFPGKENWLFDPAKDEIIKILPEAFFRNCAILIVSVIVLVSIALIVMGAFRKKNNQRGAVADVL